MQEERTAKKTKTWKQLAAWTWTTWKGYRLQAALNTLVGLLLVGSDLAFVWSTKMAVDIATHVETRFTLTFALTLLAAIIALQLVLGITSRWIRVLLGVKACNAMQAKLFARLLHSQWDKLKSYHSGDLTNRIERDVRDVISFLTETLPSLITTFVQFAGAFLLLFLMDRTLACIILFVLPFFVLCSKLYVKKMRSITHQIRTTDSRIQAIIQESLQHTLVIKALEQVAHTVAKLRLRHQDLHDGSISKAKYATLSSGLMNLGFASGYLITFAWGAASLEKGIITYGTLIAFVQLVGQIQGPVRALAGFVPIFINTSTAAERLMEIESIPAEAPASATEKLPQAGIRIKQLTFAYAPGSRNIFTDFSYDFPPGSITAVMGETGAGKTTLVRLLLALLRPVSGTATVYGGQGAGTSIAPATRAYFSYVPQGNTLFSGTIRDNLLMGNPHATTAQMEEALRTAMAAFVLSLPKGLDTPCGERGDGFSEGQAQRIAIARALLRPAPILIFDEATSSLDEQTERQVIHNIMETAQGRTMIFVTHRPEVLRHCTHTLKLKKRSTGE